MRKFSFGILAFLLCALFTFQGVANTVDVLDSTTDTNIELISVDFEAPAVEAVTQDFDIVINSPPEISDFESLDKIVLQEDKYGPDLSKQYSYAEKDHQYIKLTRAQTNLVRYPMLC